MDRLSCKRDAAACRREQTKWNEFIKVEVGDSDNEKGELKLPPKVDETFDESGWDGTKCVATKRKRRWTFGLWIWKLCWRNESWIETWNQWGNRFACVRRDIGEKLGNGLIVNELRSSASKPFDRKRREERYSKLTSRLIHLQRRLRSMRSVYGVIVRLDLTIGCYCCAILQW
ncbi:MAG: hypothetical protein ACTS7D_00375 [Candidatus Hodgkinia cicadicola]